MKTTALVIILVALAAVYSFAEGPSDSDLNGLTETEIVKKLGPPVTNFMHSATELYANAEKSSPIAQSLCEILKKSPSADVQIKTLVWDTKRLRMARLERMNEQWIVFGMEGLPEGWDEDAIGPTNQGIQPAK